MNPKPIQITYDKGSLLLDGIEPEIKTLLVGLRWDERVSMFRAPGNCYRDIVWTLHQKKIPFNDGARDFDPLELNLREEITARPHQEEAAKHWLHKGRRGVVVLPTGAGKTILAVMLMARVGRPTLVHVPTIDLMHQWHAVLQRFFDQPIGLWGGGYHETEAITVSTYDSAINHISHKGNLFGLVVYDECHRLPGDQYRFAAISAIAPFRLGLTATPERTDGREELLYQLIGPPAYRANIHELTGATLAPYEVITLELGMKAEEREAYDEAYARYRGFVADQGIRLGGAGGWKNFLYQASRSPEGRAAFKAYLRQKQLSLASSAKEEAVWELIRDHRGDRIIIFTQDNNMAYRLGKRFLLPVLTHQTRVKEREDFLEKFRAGTYSILVTSKVLNEGVDVPEANVAIIVSGSGSVREHVQRLGRILRARPGKTAVLYELISADTAESYVNQRRRRHHAYQKPGEVQDPQG